MSNTPAKAPFIRPLGLTEQLYLASRGTRGTVDSFIILKLETSAEISIDDVVHIWALVRLRHPLLASSISSVGDTPAFVHSVPRSATECLEQARGHIKSTTFASVDRDETFAALRARMADVKDDVIDVSTTTSALSWLAETDIEGTSQSHYILAIQTVHSVCDARALLIVARQLLALLAKPEYARGELEQHFADGVTPEASRLPAAVENVYPDPTSLSIDEQQRGLDAHTARMAALASPQSGITATGSSAEEDIVGHSMRHTFSLEDTSQLLKLCKSHGVTITQFVSAALVLASLPFFRPPSTATETLHFTISQGADLRSRLPDGCPDDVAIRVSIFPTSIQLPAETTTYSSAALWDIAQQTTASRDAFFEPKHLWHLVRHSAITWLGLFQAFSAGIPEVQAMLSAPSLPGFSSLGDCDALLPSVYGAQAGEQEICVRDMVLSARTLPAIPAFHLWTFAKQLNVHLTHNATHTSPELMDAYFKTVVDVITRLGIQEVQ